MHDILKHNVELSGSSTTLCLEINILAMHQPFVLSILSVAGLMFDACNSLSFKKNCLLLLNHQHWSRGNQRYEARSIPRRQSRVRSRAGDRWRLGLLRERGRHCRCGGSEKSSDESRAGELGPEGPRRGGESEKSREGGGGGFGAVSGGRRRSGGSLRERRREIGRASCRERV